jgi:hypothetical protein
MQTLKDQQHKRGQQKTVLMQNESQFNWRRMQEPPVSRDLTVHKSRPIFRIFPSGPVVKESGNREFPRVVGKFPFTRSKRIPSIESDI